MKYFFSLVLSIIALGGRAQRAPAWSWAASLGTSTTTFTLLTIATDAGGNTYVAGSFSQPLTLATGTVLTSMGGEDGFIAKYSSTGILLWYRQLTGPYSDTFQRVVTDAAGKVTLVGLASNGSQLGSTTLNTNKLGQVLILAQLDTQGQPLYLREVGSGALYAADLALDDTGNCYISGTFGLTATFGSFTLDTPASGASYAVDLFVLKVSPQGTPLWVQQGGRSYPTLGSNLIYNSSLCVEPSGGAIYLTSTGKADVGGFGSLSLPAGYGDLDIFVVKFNAQGTSQWLRRAGSAGADGTSQTTLDASGRLIVTGFVKGAATFGNQTITSSNPTTGYLWVLDPATGATVWVRTLGGTQTAAYRGVTTDAVGNIYAVGYFGGQGSLGTLTLTTASGIDGLVASYSASGNVRWTQQTSGTGDEIPLTIALDGANHLAVAGLLTGVGQFGAVAITSQSTSTGNAFVAHLGSTITATRTATAAPLTLYPNPVAATSSVTLPALPTGSQLTLIDGLGRVVRRAAASSSLPLVGLASGLYFLQATAPSGEQWASRLTVE